MRTILKVTRVAELQWNMQERKAKNLCKRDESDTGVIAHQLSTPGERDL
jgi:hypothetical protein